MIPLSPPVTDAFGCRREARRLSAATRIKKAMDTTTTKNIAIRWLYTVTGGKKLYILALILVQALYGASGVFYALFLRNIVDAAVEKDAAGFGHSIVLIVLLVAAQLVLLALIRWLSELAKSSFENLFKARLTDTLLHKDYLTVSAIHSGEWLNRLTSDARIVADNCADILPGLAGMAVKLVSALWMILVLEPRFAGVLIPCGVLLAFFSWLFRKELKRLHKVVQEADGRLRVFLQERIGSLLIIRSFSTEKQTETEADEKMREHQSARMQKNRFTNLCHTGFGAALNGIYLLGVGWCSYGILLGTISFGTLTAITQLISQIRAPFANITGYLPKYYTMLASTDRLMEAEAFPDDDGGTVELPEILELYKNHLSSLGLQDVSFTYFPPAETPASLNKENMPLVLEHLTFSLRKGEYVAFAGQSGCGKSTVLKLLMCVYQPESGRRYYESPDREIHPLTGAHRRLFAYVPQGNQLMHGTIRQIVSFAAPETARDEARLKNALTVACAEEFVSELEHGADTLLGERGAGLSEGQMQRLAIARAVFSGSPILLLDESTSALDEATESRLLSNLRSMTDKTVVIVTHRRTALSICDRVLTFSEDGVLSEASERL